MQPLYRQIAVEEKSAVLGLKSQAAMDKTSTHIIPRYGIHTFLLEPLYIIPKILVTNWKQTKHFSGIKWRIKVEHFSEETKAKLTKA